MTAATSTYGFTNVNVIYNGIAVDGFFKDTPVNITRNNPQVTSIVGADGKGVLNKKMDLSGKITIKLLNSSSANTLFAADLELVDALSTDLPVRQIFINSRNGTLLVSGLFCVVGPPTLEMGQEDQGRMWTFESTQIIMYAGAIGRIVGE